LIRAVTNDIKVRPNDLGGGAQQVQSDAATGEITDGRITERVAATLRFARAVKDGKIDVSTKDGIVSLTGPVRTEEQKERAAGIARELSGVREVKNQLYVNQQA